MRIGAPAIPIGVLIAGVAITTAIAVAQQNQKVTVEVSVPGGPELKTQVPRGAPPVELSRAQNGIVYIGHRGAYALMGAGREGRAIYRDARNRYWVRSLTFYGASGDYWVAAVGGAANTYFAFQAQPSAPDYPYYRILISTPQTNGYVSWDEATRGVAQ